MSLIPRFSRHKPRISPTEGALWVLAVELVNTPKKPLDPSRAADRKERTRRKRFIRGAGALLALSLASLCALLFFPRDLTPLTQTILVSMAVIPLGFAAAFCIAALRASTYRLLVSRAKVFQHPFWVLFYLGSLFCSVASLVAFGVAWLSPGEEEVAATVLAAPYLSGSLYIVAGYCALLASALSSPMLTSAKKPRLLQPRRALFAWTLFLIVGVVLAPGLLFVLFPAADSSFLLVSAPIWIGLLGAVVAWHRRQLLILKEQLRELRSAVLAAQTAAEAPRDRALLRQRLRELSFVVTPNPYRPQTVATLPFHAGWEFTQITLLLRYAAGDGGLPQSIIDRQGSDDAAPLFRRYSELTKDEILDLAAPFFDRVVSQLFGEGSASHLASAQAPLSTSP